MLANQGVSHPTSLHCTLHDINANHALYREDAEFCDFLAKRIGCVVIDADYAQSPEHPFPAAHEDVDTVIRWARSEAAANGWDAERISIGGFSAGGNLALVASTVGPEKASIRSVVAFYPVYDLNLTSHCV